MPIYEFKCLNCQECIELLILNTDDRIEMKCPKCSSVELERVLSCTNYSMETGSGQTASTRKRTCSSGSCTTLEIPGASR